MFAVKEQIPLNGAMIKAVSSASALSYNGRAEVVLGSSFVRRQQETQSFVYIPSCSVDGLPHGIYEIKMSSVIAMSDIGGLEVYAPKILFHSIYTSAPNFRYLTAYNHINYPFFLTTPHENFSVVLTATLLPDEARTALVPEPHLLPLSGRPTVSAFEHPSAAVAAAAAEAAAVAGAGSGPATNYQAVTRTQPRFITAIAFLKPVPNVRL